MNKHEIDGLVEPSDWEQGNWPEATEAYVRGLESALTTLSARVETLEAATWKVLAYDQLLRKVGELRAEALLAGDMPNVDAAYDDMVKTCVKALSGKTGDDHGHR